MSRFKRLDNSDAFPHAQNVDVYRYENEYDYSRFDYSQMRITLCTVPWDMGEAHVGNRTISGIGNVVYFGNESARDAWFSAIPDSECYRFETKYRALHRDNQINVPVPFDVASNFNYVMVEYANFPADGQPPVEYEDENGLRKWFWFIREVEFLSPNTTRLHLLNDAFQTFIYRVNIGGMVLERGHAPMHGLKASEYLSNPIGKCANLLAPDSNYGDARIVKDTEHFIFNACNMKAVIVTSCNPLGEWGSKSGGDWKTTNAYTQREGVPNYWAFALDAGNLDSFINTMGTSIPQFMRTVKCVCFISSDLLTLGDSFTFGGVTCNWISAGYQANTLVTLDKSMFGFPDEYDDIAKLYTYPYSYLYLYDENGDGYQVRVEDTTGTLKLQSAANLVFPWLKIDGHVTGIGKAVEGVLTFRNVTTHNMPIGGNWRETLHSWNIPTFGVNQMASAFNDYATHYSRVQRLLAASNSYDNAIASADNMTANANLNTAANSAITTRSNSAIAAEASNAVSLNSAQNTGINTTLTLGTFATIAAQEKQATIASGTAVAGAVTSLATGLATGNVAGAVGGLVGGLVSAGSTYAQSQVSIGMTQVDNTITQGTNNLNTVLANSRTTFNAQNNEDSQSDITTIKNNLITATTANNVALAKANAARDLNTEQSAVANDIAQASLEAPQEFGSWADGETAVTRPMGMFCDVVTQDASAIRAAGDEFLRYGYMFNGQWNFNGDWNVCNHFTYWKLSDFWISGLNVPDMYVDKLRFFLFGGVTVWRKPEEIGNVSIYENW